MAIPELLDKKETGPSPGISRCPHCGGNMLSDFEWMPFRDYKAVMDFSKPIRQCLQCSRTVKWQ